MHIANKPVFCYHNRKQAFFLRCFMVNVCDIHVMKPLLAEHGFHFSKA